MSTNQNTMPKSWIISLMAGEPRNITPEGEMPILSTDFLIQNETGGNITLGGPDAQHTRVVNEFEWSGTDRDLSSTASFSSSDKIFLLSPVDGEAVILASAREA